MNIKVQVCGLVLLIILFLLYCRQRTLPTYSKRAFLRIYFSTCICVLMDIASIIFIEYAAILPGILVDFVCKSYLITLILTAFCGVLYIGVDIKFHSADFRKKEILIGFMTAGICVAIYVLPIQIFCDSLTHIVYTYGKAAYMTYVGAVGLIILNFILIIKYHQHIQVRRRNTMLLWMVIWISSAVIQFIDAQLLVVGFASCLGVVISYLQFENPEINLDRESGMYNQMAFYQFLQQIYFDKSSYGAFILINDHYFARDYSKEKTEQIIGKLLKLKGAGVFKTADDEIVMLMDKRQWNTFDMENTCKEALNDVIGSRTANELKVLFMPDCRVIPHPEDFFALLRYCRRNKIKKSTRSFVYIDEAVVRDMFRENELFKKVEDAIKSNRIEVFYQPIYSTRHRKFTSAEALVRMYDEQGNLLPVFESIKASEESGQIHQIGEIVFEKVCQMIQNEHIEQYGLEYIEVNLSMAQCSDDKLAERYIHIMERNGIDPKYINLEITESATVEMKQTLLANMEQMIEYGVTFSLDDFGTGQSNLNYIMEMPVQIVKFDREMTNAYFESRKGRFVMNAAMHMIQGMELGIVSEGIETKEQLDTMINLGIDYIQGFYFSKPLPLDQFMAFVKDKNMH